MLAAHPSEDRMRGDVFPGAESSLRRDTLYGHAACTPRPCLPSVICILSAHGHTPEGGDAYVALAPGSAG